MVGESVFGNLMGRQRLPRIRSLVEHSLYPFAKRSVPVLVPTVNAG